MTRDEFIAKNPLESVCARRGIKLLGLGNERKAKCPLHKDRLPSFSVNIKKQLWRCFAGCGGGSVIDLLLKLDGQSVADFFKENDIHKDDNTVYTPPKRKSIFGDKKKATAPKPVEAAADDEESTVRSTQLGEIECTYSYQNAIGREVYQVVRYKPKDFRQRHREGDRWVDNMQGCERVLYHLPELCISKLPWVVEGEKDADNLLKIGIFATTNVGGAKKWLDSYSESLADKDVTICGDTNDVGQEHVQLVFTSIAGKAKSVRVLKLPKIFAGKPIKDVSDYIATFKEPADAKKALEALRDECHPFVQGYELPIYSMAEIEPRYARHVKEVETDSLDISKLFPSLKGKVRKIVPGEVVTIIGDTGSAKTALSQCLSLLALPMPTISFQLELPESLMFERFVAMRRKMKCSEVELAYAEDSLLGEEALHVDFQNLYICTKSGLTMEQIDNYVARSELKIGEPPKVVQIDYIQLVQGKAKDRYSRVSDVAEGMKTLAKARHVILINASQVHRPGEDETEITLHSARDSGSIEQSSGLMLGIRRDDKDKTLLHIKVLKNTKGIAGHEVLANFDGERMLITERPKIDEKDIPKPDRQKPNRGVRSPVAEDND